MPRFNVIVPVYNASPYIGKCIESILSQDFKDFDLIIIDDNSSDGTARIIEEYKVNFIRNNERIGALANIVKGIRYMGEDIIVTIDGDDYLASDDVFSYLDSIYTSDIWLTYGSFLPVSGKFKNTCQPFNKIMTPCEAGYLVETSVTPQSYRRSGLWVTSHLRTFRKWLWDLIDNNDLKNNGEYYKIAWDMAFMYPMIEMAGRHIKFIDKILYMYNDLNPNCDGTLNPMEQVMVGEEIQAKKVYAELDSHIF